MDTLKNLGIIIIFGVLVFVYAFIHYEAPMEQIITPDTEPEMPQVELSDNEYAFDIISNFLESQSEIDTIYNYPHIHYIAFEITLKHGYKQLAYSEMRQYINVLASTASNDTNKNVLIAVMDENDKDRMIYASLDGFEYYYVGNNRL